MGLSAPSGSISRRSLPLILACARFAPSSPGCLGCGDTPLAALLSKGCVGTLLSLLCLRRGVPKYHPRPTRLNCIPTSAIVWFSTPWLGKDPASLPADRPFAAGIEPVAADSGSNYWGSRRPLHRHKPAEPPLQQKEDTEKTGRLSAFWIG